MSAIDELICAAVRGDDPPWPIQGDGEDVARFLIRSAYHGVQPLLHRSMQMSGERRSSWPKDILDSCRNATVAQTVREVGRQAILKRALSRLSEIGVRPILFKGTALAYDVYPSPSLRTRGDTDLLIPDDARNQVCEALEGLGFACEFGQRGEFVSQTAVYTLQDPNLGEHQLDIHWRISNAVVLSKLFSYNELFSVAKPLPMLSSHAFAVDHVDAILIACMHRAAHKQAPYFVNDVEYYGGDRLIWLYDIHLLMSKLTQFQQDRFVHMASEKGLREICSEAIEQSIACFHTSVPEQMRKALIEQGQGGKASRFLNGSVTYQYYANFMAVEGAGNKLSFLAGLLFPPAKYMRRVYYNVKPDFLAWLYLRRIGIEVFKRLRRSIAAGHAGPRKSEQ
ncbi:nucleotidyltransferase family protein [Methylocystis sp. H62]|uniref:nucleotidyltransferase family protein n=1 Tax=Methylocystis sp. H62 TaxID=2785789 RepID=UPI0018C34122|nr:nucleotidyltransferase family protein [Methylocystis sp. H62]MBG0791941.1 nucleotidyltransferase family protein [Methylocystis sp. H62]